MRTLLVMLCLAIPVVTAGASEPPDDSVLIPGGAFIMGTETEEGDNPAHEVTVDSFYLDRHEVTNAQYAVFCEDTDRGFPAFWSMDGFRSGPEFPDHPVVGVSWSDAKAYAEWCGKRLPTEAEWERAARGGRPGLKYAHGDEPDTAQANFARSGLKGPVPVGSYSANGYDLFDMTGNVTEWVLDRYDPDYYQTGPPRNPQGPEKGRFRVIRGGGWHTGPGCCSVYFRNGLPSNWLDWNVGFRCARDGAE